MESTLKNEKLFSRNFVLTTLSTFAVFTSFYFLLVTLPIYIQELGGTESEIGLIIGVFTISAVLLRPYLGREVDRRGRKNILAAGLLVFLFSMLLYNYTTSVVSLLMLRVLHGIGWGAATTAATTLIADIAPPRRRGEAMGTFTAAFDLGIGAGSIVLGMVLQFFGFKVMYLLGGLIVLAGAAWFIAVNDKKGI
ncbi:MAG: MFS transporter [Candidatus Methanoperedens sp.]|nr:MFS transporter [Candidatus Methanoperedens sp.]